MRSSEITRVGPGRPPCYNGVGILCGGGQETAVSQRREGAMKGLARKAGLWLAVGVALWTAGCGGRSCPFCKKTPS